MTAHAPTRVPAEPSPLQRALFTLVAVAVLTAGASAWAVLASPAAARAPVAWASGVAAVIVCVTAAGAVYYTLAARRSLDRITRNHASAGRLERELAGFAEESLPAVMKRLQAGESPERALAAVPRPASSRLRQVTELVAREIGAAESRSAAAKAQRAALEDDAARLAGKTLPAIAQQIRSGEAVDAALAAAGHPAGGALGRLLRAAVQEIATGDQRGAAAMAACASAAARVQAQTTRALAELRELENRYSEDKVFADLLELDHRIAQMGRLADSIALLSGGRSGRRWTKPIVMESILRGAMSRIDAYRRVRLHSTSTTAVAGYAAEGTMHALAELMDNAASFSAHGSEVHVYVEEEDAGIVITIEDSGLGMRKRERQRAEMLVSEAHDLATLPGTRLGLAVVGRLASRYGLSVNFRPSSRGGTGVVVMIPQQLLTQPTDKGLAAGPAAAARSAVPAPAAGQPGAAAGQEDAEEGHEDAEDGLLPKRPPGRTFAAASPSAATAAAPPAPASRDAGARFAAFRQAGDRARQPGPGPGTGTE